MDSSAGQLLPSSEPTSLVGLTGHDDKTGKRGKGKLFLSLALGVGREYLLPLGLKRAVKLLNEKRIDSRDVIHPILQASNPLILAHDSRS